MRNIALVTGASSGIGKEFVREISKKYKGLDEIWVVARRRERLRELRKEIIGTRVRILPLDLMEQESFERLKGSCKRTASCKNFSECFWIWDFGVF